MANEESSLTMTTTTPGWGLWLLWVLVHIVGYAIGVGVYRAVASTLFPLYQDEQFTARAYSYELWALVAGILAGILAIAVGQGVLLWSHRPGITRLTWIIHTFTGYVVGLLVLGSVVAIRLLSVNSTSNHPTDGVGLGDQFGIACFFLAFVGGAGTIVGLAQGRLMAQHNLNSGVWAFANAISLMAFTLIFSLIVGFQVVWVDMDETLRFFLGAVIGAIPAGAITAFALVRLLRQPIPTMQEKSVR